MTKSEIIGNLYQDEKFNEALNKLCKNETHKEDLKQEIMLILLEKDDKQIKTMYKSNFLLFFTIGIIKNQYHSSTSPFWKKYRQESLELIDEIYDLNNEVDCEVLLTEKIEHYLLTEIHWFDAHIFTMYYFKKIDNDTGKILKPLSYRKIQDLHKWHGLKIDYNKVAIVVKNTLNDIKNKLKRDGYIELVDGEYRINCENLIA